MVSLSNCILHCTVTFKPSCKLHIEQRVNTDISDQLQINTASAESPNPSRDTFNKILDNSKITYKN